MQPERLGKEPASDAGQTAPEAGGRPAPTRRLKWLATAGLAALIALTSLAVARVNVWFVPPYLILMGWILLGPRAAGPRSLAEAEAEFQEAQSIPPQPPPPTPTPPPIPTPPEPDPTPDPEPDPTPRRRLFGRSRRVDPARVDAVPEPSSGPGEAPSGEPQPRASAVRGWFSRKSRAPSLDDPEAEGPEAGTESGAEGELPPSGSASPSTADDPSSAGTATKTRRRRKKKVEAPPEPPTEVAWVRIGPNQFVRQETPLPTSEGSDPPAEPTGPEAPPPTDPEPSSDLGPPDARLLAPTPGPGSAETWGADESHDPSNEHPDTSAFDTSKNADTLSIQPSEPILPDTVDEGLGHAAEVATPADPADRRPDELAGPSTPDDGQPDDSPADRDVWDGESEEGDRPDDHSALPEPPHDSNHHDGAIDPTHDDPRLERRWDEEPEDEGPTGSPRTPPEGQGPWDGEFEEGNPTDGPSDTYTNPQISNHREGEAVEPTHDDPRLERRWDEEADDEGPDDDGDHDDPRLERQWDEEPDDAGPGDPRDDLVDEPVGRDDREDDTSSSDGEEDEEDWYDDEGDDEDRWGASAAELAESIVSEGRREPEAEADRGHRPDDGRSGQQAPGVPSPAASAIPNGGGIVGYGQDLQSYLSDLINMAGGVGESHSPVHPPPASLGDAPPPRDRASSGPEVPTPREPEDRPADGDRSSPPDDDDDGAPAADSTAPSPPITLAASNLGRVDPTPPRAIDRRTRAGPDRPEGRIRIARNPGPWIKLPTLLDRSPDEPHPSRRPPSRPRPNPAPSRRVPGPGPLERYLPRAPPGRPGPSRPSPDARRGRPSAPINGERHDRFAQAFPNAPAATRGRRNRPWHDRTGPVIGRADRSDVPSASPAATRKTRRLMDLD